MNLEDSAYAHAVAAVAKFYEDAPDGKKLLDTILQSFDRHFKNPPIRDFELLLRRNFTSEEIRCALFKPTEDQIMLVLGVSPDDARHSFSSDYKTTFMIE